MIRTACQSKHLYRAVCWALFLLHGLAGCATPLHFHGIPKTEKIALMVAHGEKAHMSQWDPQSGSLKTQAVDALDWEIDTVVHEVLAEQLSKNGYDIQWLHDPHYTRRIGESSQLDKQIALATKLAREKGLHKIMLVAPTTVMIPGSQRPIEGYGIHYDASQSSVSLNGNSYPVYHGGVHVHYAAELIYLDQVTQRKQTMALFAWRWMPGFLAEATERALIRDYDHEKRLPSKNLPDLQRLTHPNHHAFGTFTQLTASQQRCLVEQLNKSIRLALANRLQQQGLPRQ